MKTEKTRAFTIIELMVSIFLTITVIASFYKLYEASLKTERSASIRVSVNLLGEQILDTIADSMRLIGLNGEIGDLQTTDSELGILRTLNGGVATSTNNNAISFSYISPYGSPITKLQTAATGDFPGCTFTLFNSAAYHSNITKLYIHNQQGVYMIKKITSTEYSGNNVIVKTDGDEGFYTAADDSRWSWMSADDGKTCARRFPAGTLVSGEDFYYNLTYTYPNLKLISRPLEKTGKPGLAETTLIDFEYDSNNKGNQTFQIPLFVLEFLKESKQTDEETNVETETREWISQVNYATDPTVRNNITAVRFGFVVLSLKDRVTAKDASAAPEMSNEYCVFKDSTNYCYKLTDPKYTASVFQRVVYLANYRMLKDQVK